MIKQRQLVTTLNSLSGGKEYLFKLNDLATLFSDMGYNALRALVFRAEKNGYLVRLCKGLYALSPNNSDGLLLYRIASHLRPDRFNYLSLESVLSETGIISQIPMGRVTLMSSGRTYLYDSVAGSVEFIHTSKTPGQLGSHLSWDSRYGLWRADTPLALSDMKRTGRSPDLISVEER